MTTSESVDGDVCIAVRDLAVRRGERVVLEGLSFTVGRGEIFGLLGPNGAGKTTAFHVLTGLLPADGGTLTVDGTDMPFGDRRLRAAIGVVFQEPALDPRLTARENLRLAARMYGVPRDTTADRIDRALTDAALADRGDDAVGTFSGGMRRRVELARALIHEPSIVILDEPTTGLDEAAFRRTWDTLTDLRERRRLTLILTTHRPEEAEYCDRLAILDGGKLVACDSPDALRARVRGDLLILETTETDPVEATLRERFGLEPRALEGRVVLEHDRPHELIPRIVEAFPDGTLTAVSMRRTGLGEVFLELTGHELAEADEPHQEPRWRRKKKKT